MQAVRDIHNQGPAGPTYSAGRRTTKANGAKRTQRWHYALLTPYLAGVVLLVVAPALLTLLLALASHDGLSHPRWLGLENFRALLTDPRLWPALRNTLLFITIAVPLRVAAALGLALLLRQRRRGIGLARSAVFLPTALPSMAYALIWLWIVNPIYGPLGAVLGALNLPTPSWQGNGNSILIAAVAMAAFQIGEGFIVLLGARHDIPVEHYESASVEGADRWQLFRLITAPLLAPWLLLLTVRDLVVGVQGTLTPVMLAPRGEATGQPWFIPQLIYQLAFEQDRNGPAAALLALLLAGVGLLLIAVAWVVRGWGYDDAA